MTLASSQEVNTVPHYQVNNNNQQRRKTRFGEVYQPHWIKETLKNIITQDSEVSNVISDMTRRVIKERDTKVDIEKEERKH